MKYLNVFCKQYIWGLSFLLLLIASCKPCDDWTDPECPNYCVDETNPLCPNYDECLKQTPVSADFLMLERSIGADPITDTIYYDTVLSSSVITQALHIHEDWTYKWEIGAGEYEGTSTALDYSTAPRGLPISVRLIVEGPPNLTCFPDDDGRDTVTRYFFRSTAPWVDTTLYIGFRNNDPSDSMTLKVYYDFDRGNTYFSGLTETCLGSIGGSSGTWKRARIGSSTFGCYSAGMYIVQDPDKTKDFSKFKGTYSLGGPAYSDMPERITIPFEGRIVEIRL